MKNDSDRWPTDEWIKQVQKDLHEETIRVTKEFCRKENSRQCVKLAKIRYSKSEKGKIAARRRAALRHGRKYKPYKFFGQSEMIREFYATCPEGYHVDHIVPLSKDGEHRMENLQWLKKSLNLKKHNNRIIPLSKYPHCRVDIEKII